MSIRARLLLLILFATLIPALVGGMQFVERRDAEIAEAQRDLATTTQRTARVLQDTVRATAQLQYGLSRSRDLDTRDRAACSAFLANVLKEYPQYLSILTFAPDGELLCDSLRRGTALNVADRGYFRQAMQAGNSLAVEPVFSRLTGDAVLSVAYAARHVNGKPAFVLVASLNLEKYMQIRGVTLSRETAVIALVDAKGTLLTWHPGGEKLRGASIADLPLFRFARAHQVGDTGEFTDVGGISRIWSASALAEFPEAGLHVLVGVSKAELLAAANRQLSEALSILAIVALLVFAGAWVVVERGIRRPVARIIEAVARFSAGDLAARIGRPHPRGEVGGLMAALDRAFELTRDKHERVIQGAAALERTSRTLKVLSEVNQALVRAPDEAAFLRDLCRVIVEFGGYLRCWVGYAEQDAAKSIRPAAQAGHEEGHLEKLNLTWGDLERGHGPMGRAIRGGAPVLEKYIPGNPDSAMWRERAVREGYAALIALPIPSNGQTLGALLMYAVEPDRFDEQELALLVDLAADLGYGIHSLRNRMELETHRHRLEETVQQRTAELVSANRFLDSVIQNIPDMVFVKEAADLRFVRFNRAGEELLGYPQEDFVGKNDYDFFPKEEAEFFTSKDREVLARGVAVDIPEELIHTRHKGDRILHTKKIPIPGEDGRPRYLLGISRDITEQKAEQREILRLNAALEQRAAEVEAANRAKSTFLATMSHEIRTPMNGVLGMLELLSLTRLDGEQRTTLEVVRESGKSLLRIIDDILDFSKIEAGKLEVRPEVTSIGEVIDSVFNLFAGNASSKGLLIKRSVNPQISPAVLVDPLRLRQILGNFVSNGLKFTAQGHIEIRADLIERVDGEDRVRFSVSDTGIGVSAEDQKRLFQPFSQAAGGIARQFGGTGLGLTICRRLAEMMGGTVEMASVPGKGTTMVLTLSLPIADVKDLSATHAQAMQKELTTDTRMRRMAPSVAAAEAEGTLALLVDDHPTNRALLMRQVHALGYAGESAGNGLEALEKWKSVRFGIVITDCNMPEMDGYELARRIRKLEAANGGKRTPIIACTANALGGEAEICFAAGMDDYLAKPVNLRDLLKKLDQWLPIPAAGVAPAANSGAAPEVRVPDADAAAPLDHSALAEITGGDAAAERDILIDFRRVNDEDAAMLKRAVTANDIPQVTRAAHRIKGASRMVGALGLATVCGRLEEASRANDWNAINATMGAFHREWMQLNAYLDSL